MYGSQVFAGNDAFNLKNNPFESAVALIHNNFICPWISSTCLCTLRCSAGVRGCVGGAERIGIFELVRLGWPERRTTQAWACSPNKGAIPLHSDWQAVRKASALTKLVTSRKWSEDSLYFFTGSHTPLMFLPRLASKSQSVFWFHLILTSRLEPRLMIEPLSTTVKHNPLVFQL